MALTKKSSKKAIRSAWVAALESGEYKQTKSVLHRKQGKKESFCCLGVLCDLAVKAKVIDAPVLEHYYEKSQAYRYNNEVGTLSDEVLNWAGLEGSTGEFVNDKGVETNLTELNDDGKKFKTIAKIISSNPEGLFV